MVYDNPKLEQGFCKQKLIKLLKQTTLRESNFNLFMEMFLHGSTKI